MNIELFSVVMFMLIGILFCIITMFSLRIFAVILAWTSIKNRTLFEFTVYTLAAVIALVIVIWATLWGFNSFYLGALVLYTTLVGPASSEVDCVVRWSIFVPFVIWLSIVVRHARMKLIQTLQKQSTEGDGK